MNDEAYDQNYDDQENTAMASDDIMTMPPSSQIPLTQYQTTSSQFFRPSPLTTLIQQQQQQQQNQFFQRTSQISSSHFLPLGSGTLGVNTPPSSQPQIQPSISSADASKLAEAGAEFKYDEAKTLLDLLDQLESFSPIIPDSIIEMMMNRAGLDNPDPKIKRLLALLTQKFITDVAQDAMQYSRIRGNSAFSSAAAASKAEKRSKDKRFVLTLEDLNAALHDHGIPSRRPPYFR